MFVFQVFSFYSVGTADANMTLKLIFDIANMIELSKRLMYFPTFAKDSIAYLIEIQNLSRKHTTYILDKIKREIFFKSNVLI